MLIFFLRCELKTLKNLSVKKVQNKNILLTSSRKNAKFLAGQTLKIDTVFCPSGFVKVSSPYHPNKFWIPVQLFPDIFGLSFEEYKEEARNKIKHIASVFSHILLEDKNEKV